MGNQLRQIEGGTAIVNDININCIIRLVEALQRVCATFVGVRRNCPYERNMSMVETYIKENQVINLSSEFQK